MNRLYVLIGFYMFLAIPLISVGGGIYWQNERLLYFGIGFAFCLLTILVLSLLFKF